jgi:hypothetical protein
MTLPHATAHYVDGTNATVQKDGRAKEILQHRANALDSFFEETNIPQLTAFRSMWL